MITGDDTITRRMGAFRGAGAGMRGTCTDCSGLGDSAAAGMTLSPGISQWLLLASLAIGAVAGSLAIYDHLKAKRRKRRRRYTAGDGRPTIQIPAETMHEIVYGRRAA